MLFCPAKNFIDLPLSEDERISCSDLRVSASGMHIFCQLCVQLGHVGRLNSAMVGVLISRQLINIINHSFPCPLSTLLNIYQHAPVSAWPFSLSFMYIYIYLFLFIYLAASGLRCVMWDLVPQPGIEPRPPALGAHSLSHWTAKEVLFILS